jgi:hypothetical protein
MGFFAYACTHSARQDDCFHDFNRLGSLTPLSKRMVLGALAINDSKMSIAVDNDKK